MIDTLMYVLNNLRTNKKAAELIEQGWYLESSRCFDIDSPLGQAHSRNCGTTYRCAIRIMHINKKGVVCGTCSNCGAAINYNLK